MEEPGVRTQPPGGPLRCRLSQSRGAARLAHDGGCRGGDLRKRILGLRHGQCSGWGGRATWEHCRKGNRHHARNFEAPKRTTHPTRKPYHPGHTVFHCCRFPSLEPARGGMPAKGVPKGPQKISPSRKAGREGERSPRGTQGEKKSEEGDRMMRGGHGGVTPTLSGQSSPGWYPRGPPEPLPPPLPPPHCLPRPWLDRTTSQHQHRHPSS